MEPKVRLKPRLAANEEPQVVKEAPPPVFLPPAAEVPPEPALVGFKLKPKAVPDESIRRVHSVLTILGGRIVHGDPKTLR